MATTGDGTTLNTGTGGDSILTEDTYTDTRTGTSGIKIATSKLRTGPNGVDGGSVVPDKNELPVTDVALIRLIELILAFQDQQTQALVSLSEKFTRGELQTFARSSTCSVTNFGASTTSGTIANSNTSRKSLCIMNDPGVSGAGNLFVLLAPDNYNPGQKPVSTSYYTVRLPPGAYYEVPGVHPGRVDGVWDAATGNAIVTELS